MIFDEQRCLSVDPHEGEYGSGEVKLEDKIVTARKARPCHLCGETIEPGTKIRVMAEAWDGRVWRQAWCTQCCVAMAKSWEDAGLALQYRSAIGRYAG
jgi:hypothetical protein